MNILHIINDKKFTQMCELLFNIDNLQNHYLTSLEGHEDFLNKNSIDVLIIHYLRDDAIKFLSSSNLKIPVIWFFWGADGFSLPKFHNEFLSRKTINVKINLLFKQSLLSGGKELVKIVFKDFISYSKQNREKISVINKMHSIVPVVPGDFEIINSKYSIKARSFHLNYVNPVLSGDANYDFVDNGDILLGNSASYTNNHIDVLDVLENMDLGDRRLIIPLSYGNAMYADFIREYTSLRKIKNVECLIEFLPLDEYNKIVSGCEIVVMNHYRQQGIANIATALTIGAAVYLNEKSTIYKYLVTNGIIVFPINSLSRLKTLRLDEKIANRVKCKELFSQEVQHERLKRLLHSIEKD
jgi:dTDP-N-acetylfucosamine:lipid II N-acetylfucosaminyltransferase